MHEQVSATIDRFLKQVGEYEIYPELTLNGDLHYHGSLNVNDRVQYFKAISKIKRLIGFCNFKYIDNYEKWSEYIKKDQDTMRQLLA